MKAHVLVRKAGLPDKEILRRQVLQRFLNKDIHILPGLGADRNELLERIPFEKESQRRQKLILGKTSI